MKILPPLLVAAFGAAGYFVFADASRPASGAKALPQISVRSTEPPLTADIATSAMANEWRQLRAQHGDTAHAFQAVNGVKGTFRQRAFRTALLGEWARRDPKAGLTYLGTKDSNNATQLAREWLRIDPNAAIDDLLSRGPTGKALLSRVMDDIARLAPERLAGIFSAMPKSGNRWDTTAQDAFERFAKKDIEAARAGAESVQGAQRAQALAGVALVWAAKDGAAALAWAQAMPPGEARDSVLKSVLAGWAKADPMGALARLDLAPPGGGYGMDASAQVLKEAATKDWDGTLDWLKAHSGKVGGIAFEGMMDVISNRLGRDVDGTMRAITTSGIEELRTAYGNALLNEGYAHRDEILQWLDHQPESAMKLSLTKPLLSATAFHDPSAALELAAKIPNTPENADFFKQLAGAMPNGSVHSSSLDELLAKAPEQMRGPLMLYGLGSSDLVASDPEKWTRRYSELPDSQRGDVGFAFAQDWAASDPTAAVRWAMSLPRDQEKEYAASGATRAWAASDAVGAASFVQQLPEGKVRDAAAGQLAIVLSKSEPEAAWDWATSIHSLQKRNYPLTAAYDALRKKNAEAAAQLLDSSGLTPAEIEKLRNQKPLPGAGGGTAILNGGTFTR